MTAPIAVELSKYIDETQDIPTIRERDIPVATIAYRALSGSWCIESLAYEFTLTDAEILAALVYYEQFRERIDAQQENIELEFAALD